MAKMTPNDLLALKIFLAEPRRNTEQNTFNSRKFSIFVELERKNDFSGNLADYSLYLHVPSALDLTRVAK